MNEQPQNENKVVTKKTQQEQNKKEDGKGKWYVTITIILLIIIIILILLLFKQCSTDVPVLNPDYPPVYDDPNADKIPGDNGDNKLEHEEGGGAVSLQFHDDLTIDISDKKAYLYFANPGRSTQDMMLQIVIQDQVIAQSGRLRPGYQLKTLDLLEGAEKKLTEGIYEGKFTVYYYNPETNEKAMVNTDAPVTITVKK